MTTKHRQSKSMGNPADYRHRDPGDPWPPDYVRINHLEERVSELEHLVNQILHEVTKKSSNDKKVEKTKKHQKETQQNKATAKANNQEAADRLKTLMQDGKERTEAEIREELGLSKGMFRRAKGLSNCLMDDGNVEKEERLYFINLQTD